MNLIKKMRTYLNQPTLLAQKLDRVQEALGRIERRQIIESNFNIAKSEFRVFSQWGEDGIIQSILNILDIKEKVFVEFGVQDYTESNTRFLLTNNNWSGLVIDGSRENINFIKKDPIYWRYNLKAECCFITKENINDILLRNGIAGEIGLLSIDIDGNDYWVWKEITSIKPSIVVVEYNARFGKESAVTIPYDPKFIRTEAHYSSIYYGASLKALHILGLEKGYELVGCNTAGNNAFFIRRDLLIPPLKALSVQDAFVCNQFRESRGVDGALNFLTQEQEMCLLSDLPIINVDARGHL